MASVFSGRLDEPLANSRPSKVRFAAFCCFPATDAWSCQALAPDLFPAAQAPNGLAGAALALPDGSRPFGIVSRFFMQFMIVRRMISQVVVAPPGAAGAPPRQAAWPAALPPFRVVTR